MTGYNDGYKDGKKEIAKKLKELNVSIEIIIESPGLPNEEIENLYHTI